MSSPTVFLITEGRLDRPFFLSIVKTVLVGALSHLVAAVRNAKELPNSSGGKPAVLEYYDFLRVRKKLISHLSGKGTIVVFCLDKDLDDLTRTKRRSVHVVYTEFFDVESYLFKYGDLAAAAAAATTVDKETFAQFAHGLPSWVSRAASSWQEWVEICVLEVTQRFASSGNYRVCPSPVHDSGGVLDAQRLAARLQLVRQNSGLDAAEFELRWQNARALVRSYYANRKADKVFKGKWYGWFLTRDVRRACAGRDVDINHLEQRLFLHLLATLNFSDDWAVGLRDRIKNLIESKIGQLS